MHNRAMRFFKPDMKCGELMQEKIKDLAIKVKGRSHVVGKVNICECGWPFLDYGEGKCIWCAGKHKTIEEQKVAMRKRKGNQRGGRS